jgi:hypothetical protein
MGNLVRSNRRDLGLRGRAGVHLLKGKPRPGYQDMPCFGDTEKETCL